MWKKSFGTLCLAAHLFYFKPAVWESVCVMENTSMEHEIENENGIFLNLLNSETEKGKIWNGKSVPLHMSHSMHVNYGKTKDK